MFSIISNSALNCPNHFSTNLDKTVKQAIKYIGRTITYFAIFRRSYQNYMIRTLFPWFVIIFCWPIIFLSSPFHFKLKSLPPPGVYIVTFLVLFFPSFFSHRYNKQTKIWLKFFPSIIINKQRMLQFFPVTLVREKRWYILPWQSVMVYRVEGSRNI